MALRRDVLRTLAGGVAAGVLGMRCAGAQTAGVTSTPLGEGVYVLTLGGRNYVAAPGSDGALLVNGGSAADSPRLLQAVAGLPGAAPVRTLFNTCWHPEQIGANQTVASAGATIIAHENTRLWLTQRITWPWDGQRFEPLASAARPSKTFYAREQATIGGRSLEWGHVRACPHTDGDCYVFFRDENVLAVGDAVSGAGWPTIDYWTGGWIGGVVGGLESLVALADDATRIVPSVGPILTRADLQSQHKMYATIYERLAEQLNRGRGPDEALAAQPTREFDAKMGPSAEFVDRAFKSLWGYLAPDA
jgi:glyoxylase-like metal-dependent hydrolase (beta-lactamase superfamily II)